MMVDNLNNELPVYQVDFGRIEFKDTTNNSSF